MKIRLKLFRGYLKYLKSEYQEKGRMLELELDEGTSIGKLAADLGIPAAEVKIILVNSQHKSLDYIIQDRDEINLFPPIAGG